MLNQRIARTDNAHWKEPFEAINPLALANLLIERLLEVENRASPGSDRRIPTTLWGGLAQQMVPDIKRLLKSPTIPRFFDTLEYDPWFGPRVKANKEWLLRGLVDIATGGRGDEFEEWVTNTSYSNRVPKELKGLLKVMKDLFGDFDAYDYTGWTAIENHWEEEDAQDDWDEDDMDRYASRTTRTTMKKTAAAADWAFMVLNEKGMAMSFEGPISKSQLKRLFNELNLPSGWEGESLSLQDRIYDNPSFRSLGGQDQKNFLESKKISEANSVRRSMDHLIHALTQHMMKRVVLSSFDKAKVSINSSKPEAVTEVSFDNGSHLTLKVELDRTTFISVNPEGDSDTTFTSTVTDRDLSKVARHLELSPRRAATKTATKTAAALQPELVEALNQLTRSSNGQRRLSAMIGAKKWIQGNASGSEDPFVTFHHMPGGKYAKLKKNAGITRLTYNRGPDTYTLEFLSNRGNKIRTFEGLHGEDLKRIFEEYTGLYLSM